MTHPWQQDSEAAAAWLASFTNLHKTVSDEKPARRTLTSLGLVPLEIALPRTLRIIPIDDVSEVPDNL